MSLARHDQSALVADVSVALRRVAAEGGSVPSSLLPRAGFPGGSFAAAGVAARATRGLHVGTAAVAAAGAVANAARPLRRAVQRDLLALRRGFCAETPKKSGWENFQPKGSSPKQPSKPGKPGDPDPSAGKSGAASESTAGKSSESASSSGGGGGAGGSSGGGEGPKTIGDLLSSPVAAQALATAALTAILATLWQSGGDAREISFQEFKNTLLEQGLVDRVEVSNKTQAKVYVRSSPIAPGASGSRGATSPPPPIPPSSSTTSTSGPWTRSSVSWRRRRKFWAWTRTSSFR